MDEARQWAEKMDDVGLFGTFADNFFLRDDECSMQYWNRRKHKKLAKGYYEYRQNILDRHIMPRFKDTVISDITPYQIDLWLVSLNTYKYSENREMTDSSKNKVLSVLSLVLDRAVYEGIIQFNPCRNVGRMQDVASNREAISEEDMKKLFPGDIAKELKIWTGIKWVVFFNIMRCTGWRPGEIAGLEKSGFEQDKNGIKTLKSAGFYGIQDRIKTTGAGKSYKIGYLDDYTAGLLIEYIGSLDSNLVFTKCDGIPLWSHDSNTVFKRALVKVGIPPEKYTQYCIRHRFMTRAKLALSREDTMELMGHTTWEQCYDHTEADEQLEKYKVVKDRLMEVV